MKKNKFIPIFLIVSLLPIYFSGCKKESESNDFDLYHFFKDYGIELYGSNIFCSKTAIYKNRHYAISAFEISNSQWNKFEKQIFQSPSVRLKNDISIGDSIDSRNRKIFGTAKIIFAKADFYKSIPLEFWNFNVFFYIFKKNQNILQIQCLIEFNQ